MPHAIAVTAIGFVSSLGVGANQSCAGARAGLNRLAALDGVDVLDEESGELVPVLGHLAAGGLVAGFQDIGRLLALSRLALTDLARSADATDAAPVPLLIGVGGDYYLRQHLARQLAEAKDALPLSPEAIVEAESQSFKEKVYLSLAARLAEQVELRIDVGASRVMFGEQASVATILSYAADALNRDDVPAVIVGGVDTLVEETRVQQLASLRLIKTPVLDSGFFAGEAAAFVRLERADRARAPRALLTGVSVARDDRHRLAGDLPLGEALSGVLRSALAGHESGGRTPGLLIDNLNGDHWQSWDLGHALARLGAPFSDLPQWHPAEAFGEIGAATVPAMVCVAVRSFERSYAPSDRIMTCVSANDGMKAAAMLSRCN